MLMGEFHHRKQDLVHGSCGLDRGAGAMTTLADLPAAPRPSALISVLAELFPVFVAERWDPHRPLKIGIDADLTATGILTPSEVEAALSSYVSRRVYLVATAAGGPSFDLNGQPVGEVTPQAADWARARLARMDARSSEKASALIETHRAAKAVADEHKAAPPVLDAPCGKTDIRPSGRAHRHSLADLRAAALARRAVEALA
jgi:sRNA-binding protein